MQKTKTTTQLILSIAMGLILFSCNQKKESKSTVDENGVREIKVDLKKSKDIDLADFADEVKYIKLETNKEGLTSLALKLVITSNGIFIFDLFNKEKVLHFSKDGEFLNTIGIMGRGPNEYIQPLDFLVDTVTKTVEIIDCFVTSSLFRYNYEGDLLEKVGYGSKYLDRFNKLQDGKYLVKLSTEPLIGENQYAIITPDFKIVNEFVPLEYPIMSSTASDISNTIDNSILFTYGWGDTIYQYINETVRAKYHVDFGNARIPDEKRNQPDAMDTHSLLQNPDINYAAYGGGICWTQTNVYFEVTSKGEKHLVCYDMESQQTSIFSNIVGSKDEIYPGFNEGVFNGNLIFTIDAVKISDKMMKEDPSSTEKQRFGVFSSFEEVQKNTYADDNPIIVLMKPKRDL